MSNPSFSNIDRWLFELVEGNLSPEQIAQLEAFLLQHPELDVDRDMWELANIEKTEVEFPHQDKFIKRKPVGLYMLSAMTSIAILISIGVFNFMELGSTIDQRNILLTKNSQNKNRESVSPQAKNKQNSTYKTSILSASSSSLDPVLNELSNEPVLSKFSGHENRNSSLSQSLSSNTQLDNFNPVTGSMTFSTTNNSNHSDVILTKPAEFFETISTRNWSTQASNKSARISSSALENNLSSKMSRVMRNLKRMMDYPVALKNMKDPTFNLPGMLALDVNNGLTNSRTGVRIQSLSRAQWLGQANEQFTNQIAVDGYAYGIRGGLGLQASHSYYGNGQLSNTTMAFIYSPKISVNRNIMVEPSVRFKMGNKQINADKIDGTGFIEVDRNTVLPFYSNSDQPLGKSLWYRDIGLGMMVNTKWFYAGVQTDNLFRHYDNLYTVGQERRAATHFIATIGTDYESKRETIGLSPYLVYHQRENLRECWVGVNSRINRFTFGTSVSDKLDLTGAIGIKMNRFSISAGVDYLASGILASKELSYQLHLRLVNFSRNSRSKLINF